MITRRTFLQTAASGSVASPLATPTEANASPGTVDRSRPLRAEPRLRVLKARRETWTRGSLRLYSDGPLDPPPLIRPEVLDAAFGKGVGRSLHQPDHWRMIEEGWFSGSDLLELTDPSSWDYAVWQANYHPECEAHDLLHDLLVSDPWPGGGTNEEFGLVFAEHPCTPRLATVSLRDPGRLGDLAARLAELTDWISLETP